MDWLVFWDASALAKRYVSEPGAALADEIFRRVATDHMACLTLAGLEVVSILVRKKNGGRLSPGLFRHTLANFRAEVVNATDFGKESVTDVLVISAAVFVESYSVNSTDAVVLSAAVDLTARLRSAGRDLLLVACDQRLIRAARAEGLATFNPETQSQTDLDAL